MIFCVDELHRLGPHTISREAPLFFVYRLGKTLEGSELAALTEVQKGWIEGAPYFLVLCDAQDLEVVTAEARRVALDWKSGNARRALAIVTQSFALRITSEMLMRAIRLVRNRPVDTRTFPDEPSARQWLAEREAAFAWEVGSAATR
jgi:hypothetical protein